MISRDKLKTFLDDLALICAKHGVYLERGHESDGLDAKAIGTGFGGYVSFCVDDEGEPTDEADIWPVKAGAGRGHAATLDNVQARAVYSLDVQHASAHRRIALERSLAVVRETIPIRKPELRVSCDYSASGVWITGEGMACPQELGLSQDVQDRLEAWQLIFDMRRPHDEDDPWWARWEDWHDREGDRIKALIAEEVGDRFEVVS